MESSTTVSKKIILVPLLLTTVFTLVGSVFMDAHYNRTAVRRYEKNLIKIAHSGVQMLELMHEMADIAELDHFADTFAADSNFRVSLIGLSGVILGDSRLSLDEIRNIDNHADRPEIESARESGVGFSRRFSQTLKINLLYVALRYNNPDRKGYFRVALPLTELENEIRDQRLMIGTFCLVAMIIAAVISLLMSRYLLKLVKKGEQHLEQRVRKRTREIELLQNLGTQLTACKTISEAIDVVGLVSSVLLPRITGTLARPIPSGDQYEIVTTWNGHWTYEPYYSQNQCWALRTGRPHMGNAKTGSMQCQHAMGSDDCMLCIPLVAQGTTHGVMHFSSPEKMALTPAEHQVASAVAENASLTLASLESRESLRQQAIKDPLTGLYNRRYLLETIEKELSRAARHGYKMGLLMIDLDRFKQFNDQHGHDTGDFILSEFGQLVKKIVRDEDIACRYGGEEFTILLPETDRKKALIVAEKIRTKTREHPFSYGHRTYGPITLSIGVAIYPNNGNSVEKLLKSADEALYRAKKTGRDRVVITRIAA